MVFKFELIVYDFDGVMTDNLVYVDQSGNEMVKVNRADGLGVNEIRKLGIKQIILSTEENRVVSSRAKKLNIDCFQGVKNKKEKLTEYCLKSNFKLENTIYVGNDINDFDVMQIVGLKLCPSDAYHKIKKISDFVLESKGGDGIARELYDYIIEKKGV